MEDEVEGWVVILVLIIVGAVLLWTYVLQPAIAWISQNWWIVTIVIGVIVVGGFLFLGWLGGIEEEEEEEMRKQAELERRRREKQDKLENSIIRKKLLKERGSELEGLSLTEEEKEFQINKWVEEAYRRQFTREEPEPRFKPKIAPPLSQSHKERLIQKVGTKCCYPHCRETESLDVHHIIPRSKEGTNKESNLVVLCPTHHTKADRGAIPRERLKLYSVARMKKRE